jgi:hypothetical protein
VPAGTVLTLWSGGCTITTDGLIIDAKIMNCDVTIRAHNVVIRNSKINGQIGTPEETDYSYSLTDSDVDAGQISGAAVGSANITLLRVDVRGGNTSVYCWAKCDIRDSWLHAQWLPNPSSWHVGAFLANDGSPTNSATGRTDAYLYHNTIHCEPAPVAGGGGCSGDINLYGDFGPIRYVTIDNNLFKANVGISYCVYGGDSVTKPWPDADHVVITNNTFERGETNQCGAYGPVSSFDSSAAGNIWTGNVWDTGGVVAAAN